MVRAGKKRREKKQLEQLLIQSLNSGEPIDITPEMLDDFKAMLRARAESRKPATALDSAVPGMPSSMAGD